MFPGSSLCVLLRVLCLLSDPLHLCVASLQWSSSHDAAVCGGQPLYGWILDPGMWPLQASFDWNMYADVICFLWIFIPYQCSFMRCVTWWNNNSIFLSFWQFSSVCENERASFCAWATFPSPVWIWSHQDHPETFSVCRHTGKHSLQRQIGTVLLPYYNIFERCSVLPRFISKFICLDITASAGSAFPPGESYWLCESGLWSWTSVYVQVDGQLAISTRMALLRPLLPLAPAVSPPAHPVALCPPPMEEVRQTLPVSRMDDGPFLVQGFQIFRWSVKTTTA